MNTDRRVASGDISHLQLGEVATSLAAYFAAGEGTTLERAVNARNVVFAWLREELGMAPEKARRLLIDGAARAASAGAFPRMGE